MWTLIKRDIWSTKGTWLFVFLVIIGIGAISQFAVISTEEGVNGISLQLPLLVLVMLSNMIVAHICRTEDENGVRERMEQLPISIGKIVFSRYLSSLLLLTIVYFFTYLVASLFLGGSVIGMGDTAPAFYLFFHAILLIISIYLPFYFLGNSNGASWAVRLFFMFWIVYVILATLLFHYEFRRRFTPIPLSFFDMFFKQLFYVGLLIIVVSLIVSTIGYGLKLQAKNTYWLLLAYMLFILALLLATPFLAERSALSQLEEDVASIQLETMQVEPIIVDGVYELQIDLTLSAPRSIDNSVFEQISVTIGELGFYHNKLEYFDQISMDKEKQYFSHRYSYPEILSEDEAMELVEKIEAQNIKIEIEHGWLRK